MGLRGPVKMFEERVTVPVPTNVKDRIRSQAETEGVAMAEVVRRALDQVMEEESWEPEPTR